MRKIGWWVILTNSLDCELARIFVEEKEGSDLDFANDLNLQKAVIKITKDGLTGGDKISIVEGESE